MAAFGGCIFTRRLSALTFEARGSSMLTSDMFNHFTEARKVFQGAQQIPQ
jgi:NAD(P)H-hydrate repair Nnr-like enzyme with NAD(P)H-hydrate dehydratase domain